MSAVVFGATIRLDSAQESGRVLENGPMGPVPNSGDGIPDGSGIDVPNGPNKRR